MAISLHIKQYFYYNSCCSCFNSIHTKALCLFGNSWFLRWTKIQSASSTWRTRVVGDRSGHPSKWLQTSKVLNFPDILYYPNTNTHLTTEKKSIFLLLIVKIINILKILVVNILPGKTFVIHFSIIYKRTFYVLLQIIIII